MSSCCGSRKPNRGRGDDTEPLLPRYEEDTSRQRQLRQKLHSYQMYKAISEGYMPSNEQVITNLRTLLASDILNPRSDDLSEPGIDVSLRSRRFVYQDAVSDWHRTAGGGLVECDPGRDDGLLETEQT